MFTTKLREIRLLGEGGFGKTTLIESDEDHRYVLKRFKKSAITAHGDTAINLFLLESEYLRKLGDHPQIPALIGSGTDENGPWIIQQYISGENLEQILAKQLTFTEAEIINLLKSLLPVVGFIHAQHAIHRDIKPANIIWSDNQYFLVDFGASKRVSETVLRKTGTTIGSAGYAAPEQTVGKAIFASDLYSLGVTCAHLLTGISPFDLIDVGTGQWCWRDYMQTPVSEGFGLILDKMLEQGTYRRYQSVADVLLALGQIDRRTIARQRVEQISRIGKRKQIVKWSQRAVVGVAAGAVIVGAGFGVTKMAGMIQLPEKTVAVNSEPFDLAQLLRVSIDLIRPVGFGIGTYCILLATRARSQDDEDRAISFYTQAFILIVMGSFAPQLLLALIAV